MLSVICITVKHQMSDLGEVHIHDMDCSCHNIFKSTERHFCVQYYDYSNMCALSVMVYKLITE